MYREFITLKLKLRNSQFIKKYGFIGLFKLLISPLLQIIFNPIAVFKTIINTKVLFNCQWKKYSRFSIGRSFNSAWHRLYDAFLERYGRNGYCYEMGMGQSLVTKFYYTKLSMRFYRYNEIITSLIGGIGFLVVFYLVSDRDIFTFYVLLSVLFSSFYFFVTIESMKYDALAWVFAPLLLYAINFNEPIIIFITLYIILFLSISVFIPLMSILFIMSYFQNIFLIVFIVLFVLFLLRFRYLLRDLSDFKAILTLIGMDKKGKSIRKLSFDVTSLYIISTQVLFILYYGLNFKIDNLHLTLLLVTIILYIVNIRFSRFADIQTMYFLILLSYSYITVFTNDFMMLVFLWIIISPAPFFLSFTDSLNNNISYLSSKAPFEIESKVNLVNHFFQDIEKHSRVFFYHTYRDNYHPDFDGYASIKEFLAEQLYFKNSSLFPDYYIFTDYYAGKFDLNILLKDKAPCEIVSNMKLIGSKYIIVSELHNSKFNDLVNLKFVNSIDIKDLIGQSNVGVSGLYPKNFSKLYLYQINEDTSLVTKGTLLNLESNYIRLITNSEGEAGIKYLFDTGWKSLDNAVTIEKDELGFILCKGKANMIIELYYNYFKKTNNE